MFAACRHEERTQQQATPKKHKQLSQTLKLKLSYLLTYKSDQLRFARAGAEARHRHESTTVPDDAARAHWRLHAILLVVASGWSSCRRADGVRRDELAQTFAPALACALAVLDCRR